MCVAKGKRQRGIGDQARSTMVPAEGGKRISPSGPCATLHRRTASLRLLTGWPACRSSKQAAMGNSGGREEKDAVCVSVVLV